MNVRSRWVTRDLKTRGDREHLICATLELLRLLLSRQATRSMDGKQRKTMFKDVKKAHLVPECREMRSTSSYPRKRNWSQTSVGCSSIGFLDDAGF